MNQANLPSLPAAILAEKRSNWPFLLRFALVFIGLGIIMKGLTDHNALLALWVGVPVMAGGLIGMGLYLANQHVQNTALLDSLTQAELLSMIGRQGDTWRSDDQIIRVLDRRFPAWRQVSVTQGEAKA